MPSPRSLRDTPTIRSVLTSPLSRLAGGSAYLQLYQLSTERHRLEREAEEWERRRERIAQRLGQIEEQMRRLAALVPVPGTDRHRDRTGAAASPGETAGVPAGDAGRRPTISLEY